MVHDRTDDSAVQPLVIALLVIVADYVQFVYTPEGHIVPREETFSAFSAACCE
jgi:hypothetical protein